MLGNMMELNKPTKRMLHIAKCPEVIMEIVTRAAAHTAQMPSSRPVFIFCKTPDPINRPTMAPPQ